MAANEGVAAALHVLEQKYAHVPKVRGLLLLMDLLHSNSNTPCHS
jgi:hypothetical protein